MAEIAQAYQWSIALMQADTALVAASTGGIWQGFADQGTPGPYTLVTAQTPGVDALTMNAKRLFSRGVLQIKAVGPTSGYAALVIIANRIDAIFGRTGPAGLSVGGVLDSYREQQVAYEELVNGQSWSHLGGLYHIDLQGS
jgi:hypothetical protein